MVPDKFNMVDMGGIDIIMMQGETVPGLYYKLLSAISQCSYQCLYNWMFDGVVIPPTYVQMQVNDNGDIEINEGVTVTDEDVIHVYSLEIPIFPPLQSIEVTENGTYIPEEDYYGFDEVEVEVIPPLQSIEVTENGTYTPEEGYYGFDEVEVSVEASLVEPLDYVVESHYYTAVGNESYYGDPVETSVSYELEIGRRYILSLSGNPGNRFRRGMFDVRPFTILPATIPPSGQFVVVQTGVDVASLGNNSIGNPATEDPVAYSCQSFTATKRYLEVHLSRTAGSEPEVYLFKLP